MPFWDGSPWSGFGWIFPLRREIQELKEEVRKLRDRS